MKDFVLYVRPEPSEKELKEKEILEEKVSVFSEEEIIIQLRASLEMSLVAIRDLLWHLNGPFDAVIRDGVREDLLEILAVADVRGRRTLRHLYPSTEAIYHSVQRHEIHVQTPVDIKAKKC